MDIFRYRPIWATSTRSQPSYASSPTYRNIPPPYTPSSTNHVTASGCNCPISCATSRWPSKATTTRGRARSWWWATGVRPTFHLGGTTVRTAPSPGSPSYRCEAAIWNLTARRIFLGRSYERFFQSMVVVSFKSKKSCCLKKSFMS